MSAPRFTLDDTGGRRPARLPAWLAAAAWLSGFLAGVVERRAGLRGQLTAAELRALTGPPGPRPPRPASPPRWRCSCDGADRCPLGRVGSEERCTVAELAAAGFALDDAGRPTPAR